jgi:hypothetical protein
MCGDKRSFRSAEELRKEKEIIEQRKKNKESDVFLSDELLQGSVR